MTSRETDLPDASTATQSPLPEEAPQDLLLDQGLEKIALYPASTGSNILRSIEKPDISALFRRFPVLKAMLGLTVPKAKKVPRLTVKQIVQEAQLKQKKQLETEKPTAERPRIAVRRVRGEEMYEDLGLLSKVRRVC